jgi:PqqD family protein of HPr-rel-A system
MSFSINPFTMKIRQNIAVSENGFVFDPSSGDSYSLNSTGCEIVALIKEGFTFEEIREKMTQKYNVDNDPFERFFNEFVELLKHYQLIEEANND